MKIQTRDGAELSVRPIEADDEAALADNFDHLSPETVYRRFLAPLKHLTSRDLTYLTHLDHDDHEALVALDETGTIVGVARYIRNQQRPTHAEVAVTVADEWQGRGVGTRLLGLLAERGREQGLDHFIGICLVGNKQMLKLFDELGPTECHHSDAGTIEVEVELPISEPRAINQVLRAAAQAAPGPPRGR